MLRSVNGSCFFFFETSGTFVALVAGLGRYWFGEPVLTEVNAGIKEYSDWPTIPQLYVDNEFVGGCDILMSMHQNGELSKLLEEKGVLVAAEPESGSGAEKA